MYISTRNEGINISASEAILNGLAADGGLFVSATFPNLRERLEELIKLDYQQLAVEILDLFLNDFEREEIVDIIKTAYDKFEIDPPLKLKRVEAHYLLELFYGKTLAFKDMALSVLPYLLSKSLEKQNVAEDMLILAATSGDTGSAALSGIKSIERLKAVAFFPSGGVSEIQKRQMLAEKSDNTTCYQVFGNFDDCQTAVKTLFADKDFKQQLQEKGYILSSANSINIGRLLLQIVYYFYSYGELVKNKTIKLGDKVNFVVPSGNFGNILAAYYAKKMGLPVNHLICASNQNKVLTDFFNTGKYSIKREFYKSISPSMDILIASNLERLLFDITKDAELVKKLMLDLKDKGEFILEESLRQELKDFYAYNLTEEQTLAVINKVKKEKNYLLDPHSAVAYGALEYYLAETGDKSKNIVVATASPYKFSAAVLSALDENETDNLLNDLEKLAQINQEELPKVIREVLAEQGQAKAITREEMKEHIFDFVD